MSYEIRSVSDNLGVEVLGLDLRAPIDKDTLTAVNRAFVDNVVLVFRDQDITPQQLLSAAEQFGEPMAQKLSQFKVAECPMVSYVSNQAKADNGSPKLLGKEWHTDHSFQPEPPKATVLHGVQLPAAGGNTWFANMRRAYEALPEKTRQRIDDLQAVHAYRESRDALTAKQRAEKVASGKGAQDGTVHPVVRTHDETGARAIYINPLRLERFVGLGPEESTALVEELVAHATSAAFTYAHSWRQGDVIIWDNRQAMHRAEHNYDLAEIRLMHRIILKGQRPI